MNMSNILVKNPDDLLISRSLKSFMGSFLVGRNYKRYNRPVELCFVGLNDRTLVGSAIFCFILRLDYGYQRLVHKGCAFSLIFMPFIHVS